MFVPFEDYDEIDSTECPLEDALNTQNQILRWQMANEYTQSTMKSVFDALFEKKAIESSTYYQSGSVIILQPCSDMASDSQLKNIHEVLVNVDISQANTLLFAVAEEQPMINKRVAGMIMNLPVLNLWNPPRDHWVTVHYDIATQVATLIDSRSKATSAWYDDTPMQTLLRNGLASVGLALTRFEYKYQGLQSDNIHCGAWTVANISALAKGETVGNLRHHISIDEIIEAQIQQVFSQSSFSSEVSRELDDEGSDTLSENSDEADHISLNSVNTFTLEAPLEHLDDEGGDNMSVNSEDTFLWMSLSEDQNLDVERSCLDAGARDLTEADFNQIIERLNLFSQAHLNKAEFSTYRDFLVNVISKIQKHANNFFQASPEEKDACFVALRTICAYGFVQLTEKFKPRDDLFFGIQTFFKALVGILLAVIATLLTFGGAGIYLLCNKDLNQKYRDTFFLPETRAMTDMKAKWAACSVSEDLLGQHGWLARVENHMRSDKPGLK